MPFAGHAGAALIVAGLFGLNPLLVLLGSLIPDLDAVIQLFGVKWTSGHRKITHSLLFLNLFLVSAVFFPVMLPVAIGLVTHFVTDLDHWGLPLFYPFSSKCYSVMKVDHKRGNDYDSAEHCISEWFKRRDWKFYFEWGLLGLGIFLTWGYWVSLLSFLLGIIFIN